ncbi:MAG TPA: AbrB family transcriptional regulator [Nocardioides sp.]|uniref:AbrB family transcriptional regulator n=1 Tax=Nocardioides sp. TaxID=35761 RepID=UPI002EDA287C
MSGRERTRWHGAALVVAVTVAASAVLQLVAVPSAPLFGSLFGGMAHALTSRTPLELPAPAFRVAQAMIGVIIGASVSLPALTRMGSDAVAIALVTAGTIGVSLIAGRMLAVRRDVSPVTGAFAMIAGGASGVVAVAHDLGADDRVVTVVQYLRVLIVLVTLPVVTAVVFRPEHGLGLLPTADAPLLPSLAYVALALLLGLLLARLVPVTTAVLLGPFLVGAVLSQSGWLGTVAVPTALEWLAYAAIGVQVGLRFTRESVASIARMLPAVIAVIAAMIAVNAAMGAALARLTPVDGLTAYLATTPGGLFAVLATAADTGADVTYVMAVQLVRLVVILATLPLLARWLRRGARADET